MKVHSDYDYSNVGTFDYDETYLISMSFNIHSVLNKHYRYVPYCSQCMLLKCIYKSSKKVNRCEPMFWVKTVSVCRLVGGSVVTCLYSGVFILTAA